MALVGGFDSATAKMVRVVTYNRKALDAAIWEYTRSNPAEMASQPNGADTLHITKQPPVEISVIAGEIFYHCRSALDHLFFDLVKRCGTPTGKWERNCYFPLTTKPAAFPGNIEDWFPKEILATLERLQPYHRGNHLNRMLLCLHELSNIDKHRNLNITVTKVTVRDIFTASNGYSVSILHPALDDGTKLTLSATAPIGFENILQGEVKVERKVTPIVVFDEPKIGGADITNQVQSITDGIPSAIIHYIIPVLKKFLGKP
jgi:hypothetical protein